jgi:hypothetical protein
MWTDYLDFFDVEVKLKGIQGVLEDYAFHPAIIPRLVSGALHPIIHLGFGVEFEDNMIIAEGLAEAAIHKNRLERVIEDEFWSQSEEYTPIAEILGQIQQDNRLDNVLKYEDDDKFVKITSRKPDIIREYVNKFGINENTVWKRYQELYRSTILAYAASAQRPDVSGVKLDFFL